MGRGVSRFYVENLLSHSSGNLRRESFTVALFSGTEKNWRRRGEYQESPSKIFCLTVPKISVGNTLLLHYFRVAKKFGEEVGWGVSRIYVENLLSHSAEIFRMGILYCCIIFGYRKKLEKKGEYQDSPSKNFCLTVPKISVGNTLLLHYFRVPKKFGEEGGGYQDFTSKNF